MPALYRITEQQVLASAGLDAFVFLTFFKMSMKLFAVMFFFAAVVLEPINYHFGTDPIVNATDTRSYQLFGQFADYKDHVSIRFEDGDDDGDHDGPDVSFNLMYLWSYLVFTYFFTALTLWFVERETYRVLRIRQDYLGSQSTITDRTFRVSGIPTELRTEEAIKDLVERLEIGQVESVTLCREWKELDDLLDERQSILAKLEETWSVFLNQKTLQPAQDQTGANGAENGGLHQGVDEESGESDRLLRGTSSPPYDQRPRPQTRFWYGFLRLQSRKTDALDYYTEKLRLLDEKIVAARKKKFEAADLAFVTMDSIAACQMAIQALIDPRPGQLLTKPAPAPSDIVWRNTYAGRFGRRVRSWSVTVFVGVLSVLWLIPVAFLASVLSICTIEAVFPSLAKSLREHEILRSLVQTGLPTAVVSLLNIAVPYLYDYLSYKQGMLSQGDIALSVISKNFFFTFFNIFLIFTVFGAVTSIIDVLRHSLKDSTYIALTLARQIKRLSVFYTNFIMLQGIGLFPFRLLEFGSVALYPILRLGAKTPRDFAQILEPPMFYYGFYLPTALLVFILCLVYSALPKGYLVLGLGLLYFSLGYFTYKYQLLYAMDQPQHATGGAWRMICYRIMLGLVVFQLTMSGYLALQSAFTVAVLVIPLLVTTVWYSYAFRRQFEPLTRFISLRSIKRGEDEQEAAAAGHVVLDDDLVRDEEGAGEREVLRRRGSTIDEDREKGLRFINPSLVVPYVLPSPFLQPSVPVLTCARHSLQQPWIYADPPPPVSDLEAGGSGDASGYESRGNPAGSGFSSRTPSTGGRGRVLRHADTVNSTASSEVSLGDTHVWRDS